jgi:hypothetical protein
MKYNFFFDEVGLRAKHCTKLLSKSQFLKYEASSMRPVSGYSLTGHESQASTSTRELWHLPAANILLPTCASLRLKAGIPFWTSRCFHVFSELCRKIRKILAATAAQDTICTVLRTRIFPHPFCIGKYGLRVTLLSLVTPIKRTHS